MIDAAIETFVHGFAFTRSLTHPYLADRVGPLWRLRDGPRRRPPYRREEWVANGQAAANVDPIVRRHAEGRFAICAVVESPDDIAACRDDYKALGYRLHGTEPVMAHDLARVPRAVRSPATVERVDAPEMADRVNKAAGRRQVLPEHLVPDAPLRQYAATVDGAVVGWVRSIVVGQRTWCSNMHVVPAHRRRGIGRAMLAHLLRDDRRHGSTLAVLTASHTGALLYPTVGFRQVGTLLLLTPRRA
jgi:GNAT superfamily N-acetyltransferase